MLRIKVEVFQYKSIQCERDRLRERKINYVILGVLTGVVNKIESWLLNREREVRRPGRTADPEVKMCRYRAEETSRGFLYDNNMLRTMTTQCDSWKCFVHNKTGKCNVFRKMIDLGKFFFFEKENRINIECLISDAKFEFATVCAVNCWKHWKKKKQQFFQWWKQVIVSCNDPF